MYVYIYVHVYNVCLQKAPAIRQQEKAVTIRLIYSIHAFLSVIVHWLIGGYWDFMGGESEGVGLL